MTIRKELIAVVTALSAGLVGCAVDPASPEGADPSATELGHGRACTRGPSGETACYDTLTEAVAAITNGEIADAPADPKAVAGDAVFAARVNAVGMRARANRLDTATNPGSVVEINVLNAITYKDANYGGDAWLWYRSTGCDGNPSTIDWSVSNLNNGSYDGWNDEISSFLGYNNCLLLMYEDWNFLGAATNGGVATNAMSYVGNAMNDRITSFHAY